MQKSRDGDVSKGGCTVGVTRGAHAREARMCGVLQPQEGMEVGDGRERREGVERTTGREYSGSDSTACDVRGVRDRRRRHAEAQENGRRGQCGGKRDTGEEEDHTEQERRAQR